MEARDGMLLFSKEELAGFQRDKSIRGFKYIEPFEGGDQWEHVIQAEDGTFYKTLLQRYGMKFCAVRVRQSTKVIYIPVD